MLLVGLAVILVAVEEVMALLGAHTYVLAPLTLSVADAPIQIEALLLEVNVGEAFTETATVLDEVQPDEFVPVTV